MRSPHSDPRLSLRGLAAPPPMPFPCPSPAPHTGPGVLLPQTRPVLAPAFTGLPSHTPSLTGSFLPLHSAVPLPEPPSLPFLPPAVPHTPLGPSLVAPNCLFVERTKG